MPYHVFGASDGARALMSACRRVARVQSGSGISAILANTSASPSPPPLRPPRPASAFTSRARSRIAARSSRVKAAAFFSAPDFLAPRWVAFLEVVMMALHLYAPDGAGAAIGPPDGSEAAQVT